MTEFSQMIAVAGDALVHALGLAPADRVLVLTDEQTRRVGEAFEASARDHGCAAKLHLLAETGRPLGQVPADLSALLGDTTVVINAIANRKEEIPFRVAWLRQITATRRIRCGHSPGITEEMFEAGPLGVDYSEMIATAERLIGAFAGVVTARITTPAGTDLTLGLFGRPFTHDCLGSAEVPVNLPCGEIFCAPVETDADGVLVVDGSIGALGRVASPVRIHLREGRITRLTCDDAELAREATRLTGLDDEASVIGELGIGINPGARIVGNMLEDEKAFRTAHIAFGNNEDMPEGRNRSCTHLDFLFNRPTIEVTHADGAVRTLLQDGGVRI